MSTNRPPSCDLPPEFYQPKLKECPSCGAEAENSSCNKSVFRCSDTNCLTYGPWGDPHGHKWNSIPRRSEVAELLRLLCQCEYTQIGEQELFYRRFNMLSKYADKIRKEWNL